MPATRAYAAVFLIALAVTSLADDSAMVWSGAPKMMSGHPTITMVSERIDLSAHDITQDEPYTLADCTFVFHNAGPACSVRMGFPDRATGAYEEDYKPVLQNFKSWVNGVPAKTSTVVSQYDGVHGATYTGAWHEKVVNFAADQTLTVRDTYRQPASGGIAASGGSLTKLQYVLSTGASWKGPIGSVLVTVHIPGVVSAEPLGSLTSQNPYAYTGWGKVKKGEVFYVGFGKPEVGSQTLTFRATNLKPTAASDIAIFWPD